MASGAAVPAAATSSGALKPLVAASAVKSLREVTSVSIPASHGFDIRGDVVYYHVELTTNEWRWRIAKRYSAFEELDSSLRKAFTFPAIWASVEFPKKKFKLTTNHTSAEFIASRRAGLEKYLRELLAHDAIRSSDGVLFLFLTSDRLAPHPPTAAEAKVPFAAAAVAISGPAALSDAELFAKATADETSRDVKLQYERAFASADAARVVGLLNRRADLSTLRLFLKSLSVDGARQLSEVLKANRTLTYLVLQCGSIPTEALDALMAGIAVNTKLVSLRLDNCALGDAGAAIVVRHMKSNHTLRILNLEHNDITDAAVSSSLNELLHANRTLTSLSLQANALTLHGAHKLLSTAATGATGAPTEVKTSAPAVSGVSTLVQLNLRSNKIAFPNKPPSANGASSSASAGIAALTLAFPLTSLNLSLNPLSDGVARPLAAYLSSANPTLTRLNLSYCSLSDAGVMALADGLGSTNCRIRSLTLSINQITSAGFKHFVERVLTPLPQADGTDSKVPTAATSGLRFLNVSVNGIDNSGVEALATALRTNRSLVSLNLSTNELSDAGALAVLKALPDNPTIKRINFDNNELSAAAEREFAAYRVAHPNLLLCTDGDSDAAARALRSPSPVKPKKQQNATAAAAATATGPGAPSTPVKSALTAADAVTPLPATPAAAGAPAPAMTPAVTVRGNL